MTPLTRHRHKPSPKLRLPIYKNQELFDLYSEPSFTSTDTLSPIETGIPKDEEKELDLSAALSAAQDALTTGSTFDSFIPVPNVSNTVISDDEYSRLYKANYQAPETLIRFLTPMDDMLGCSYVMDNTDDSYLAAHRETLSLSEDDLEKLLWEYETIANEQLPDLHLDVSTIPDYKDFLCFAPESSIINTWPTASHVYRHWKGRRIQQDGRPIIPALVIDSLTKHGTHDPYVCFKRREKPPCRANMDATKSLSDLQVNMAKARHLLAMVIRRETVRKEQVVLEHNIFSITIQAYQQQQTLGIKNDRALGRLLTPKRQQPARRDGLSLIDSLLINNELLLRQQQDALYEDVSVCLYQPSTEPLPARFFKQLSLLRQNHQQDNLHHPAYSSQTLYRSRIGRGGRVLLDRAHFRSSEPSAFSTPPEDETDTDATYVGK